MHPRPLIFLHMPKAGGTTLEAIVKRQYAGGKSFRFTGSNNNAAEFRALPETERASFDLLSGHVYFGIHDHVPEPCTYITMLRHPVERIISLYHYVKRSPQHYLHEHGFADRRDVEDFVRRPITVETDNWQTRLLNPQPESFLPSGGADRAMFEKALENLTEHFAVAGVTERFDESLSVLGREFGWADLTYERRNTTQDRPEVGDLPDSTVEAILEANSFDAQLHETAQTLLQEKIIQFSRCE